MHAVATFCVHPHTGQILPFAPARGFLAWSAPAVQLGTGLQVRWHLLPWAPQLGWQGRATCARLLEGHVESHASHLVFCGAPTDTLT